MTEIPLTKGYVAIIDDEDVALVSQYSWHIMPNFGRGFYAAACSNGGQTIRMHRLILGAQTGEVVDHINRNGLDNRRSNLRLANRSLNAANSKHRRDRSSSPFRGVYAHDRRFRAEIRVNTKLIRLGSFVDPVLAALAYDEAARKYFGDFAQCNFEGCDEFL